MSSTRMVSRLPVWIACLALSVLWVHGAHAQMCSVDAGCDDAGDPLDSGMMTPMDAAMPEDDADAMTPGGDFDASTDDAGSADDGGTDSGMSDAGDGGGVGSVAACSCDISINNEGAIHVCTGSF